MTVWGLEFSGLHRVRSSSCQFRAHAHRITPLTGQVRHILSQIKVSRSSCSSEYHSPPSRISSDAKGTQCMGDTSLPKRARRSISLAGVALLWCIQSRVCPIWHLSFLRVWVPKGRKLFDLFKFIRAGFPYENVKKWLRHWLSQFKKTNQKVNKKCEHLYNRCQQRKINKCLRMRRIIIQIWDTYPGIILDAEWRVQNWLPYPFLSNSLDIAVQ